MKSTRVEGVEVKIGDSVGFKSDVEQSGTIDKIRRNGWGQVELVLTTDSDCGFHGDYIGGRTTTVELAEDCWVD